MSEVEVHYRYLSTMNPLASNFNLNLDYSISINGFPNAHCRLWVVDHNLFFIPTMALPVLPVGPSGRSLARAKNRLLASMWCSILK